MKNFSVKTADFDSLSISGEAPIVQSDLGTAPNQIPLNKDLGSLAYMNAPQIEDINVDTLELREIAAELSETAVDVFVYDTRKDSDGGAWRSRTSHTSWYNEELNTATRGGRREFPAVAVIVAETNKVTIYDGDDPDLSMWMVFNKDTNQMLFGVQVVNSVSMLNGIFAVVSNNGYHAVNFLNDSGELLQVAGLQGYLGAISERNDAKNVFMIDSSINLINNVANDVAMTVLPNAPIDADTGLPIPTIAVATDGGVSVIKDDGTVVDITSIGNTDVVGFDTENKLLINENDKNLYVYNLPSSDTTGTGRLYRILASDHTSDPSNPKLIGSTVLTDVANYAVGQSSGLTLIDENTIAPSKSMVNYITSTYNTGWMPGDIKLATLSDTKNETVGVDESTELVNNGHFTNDTNGWTEGTGATISVDSATTSLKVEQGTSDFVACSQPINTIVGKKYTISFDLLSDGNSSVSAGIYVRSSQFTGGSNIISAVSNGAFGSQSATFTAIGSVTYIEPGMTSSADNIYGLFDNISVKQTGELITNGTFDSGTTGWETTSVTNSLISVTNEQLTVDRNSVAFIASGTHQAINTVIGEQYTVSVDVVSATHFSNLQIVTDASTQTARGNTNIGDASFDENGKTGTLLATFTATTSVTYVILTTSNDPNATSVFDNVSARLAEDDRSVNDNGLQVFGEITKTPVAPGADLVAYSGFSADDYLMQPYNSDLDFGTGDFSIIAWVNKNGTANQVILHSSGNLYLYISSGNQLRFAAGGAGTSVYGSIGSNSIWNQIAIVRKDGIVYGYINGVLQASYSNPDAVTHSSNDTLKIGLASTGSLPFTGSLSLLRVSATAPTAEQIAKIYRDEKPLFQDGAQATLYGTSDAVTALAYDDSDDLLHVGTASGRSSFNGLKRVDNTTTAVSTAISATEGLVIEQ